MCWSFTYLSIALLVIASDATNSAQHRRRFSLVFAFLMAVAWPLTLPLGIARVRKATRNFRPW
jgi:hypothetical protein